MRQWRAVLLQGYTVVSHSANRDASIAKPAAVVIAFQRRRVARQVTEIGDLLRIQLCAIKCFHLVRHTPARLFGFAADDNNLFKKIRCGRARRDPAEQGQYS